MSDGVDLQQLVDNFSHDNPLRRFMAGSAAVEPCAVDELRGALDAHMKLIASGGTARLRIEHTEAYPGSALDKIQNILNELREVHSVADSHVDVRRSDWTLAFSGSFGEMVPAFVLQDWKRIADANIASVDAAATGNEVIVLLTEYQKHVETIRSMFFLPLINELADIGYNAPTISLSVQGTLSSVLDGEREKRLNTYEQRAATSAGNAERSSGDAATARQRRTFEQFASDEASLSKWWTSGVFVFVLAAIVGPVALLSFDVQVSNLDGWLGTAVKLLVALPLLGIATYCGGVAGQHRELARRMKLLGVQVDTIDSYIERMSEDQQSRMREVLGIRLFSDVELRSKAKDGIGVVSVELIPLLEQAMAIAKDATQKSG